MTRTRIQRAPAKKEEGPAGQLTPYLNQRGQARSVPPRGAEGSPESLRDVLQTKPLDARLARARALGHRPPSSGET